jgi:hypothetical protein
MGDGSPASRAAAIRNSGPHDHDPPFTFRALHFHLRIFTFTIRNPSLPRSSFTITFTSASFPIVPACSAASRGFARAPRGAFGALDPACAR